MNLIRVDDRLIHGQVSVGWSSFIDPSYMIISDDEIAADKNEAELYLLGVPFGYEGKALSIKDTVAFINSLKKERFILVLRSLNDALNLYKSGFEYKQLNLGGLHFSEGKKEINHYLYLDGNDINVLKEICELGIEIFVQDLPANSKYRMDYVYKKWNNQ